MTTEQKLREALDEIGGLSRALRHGGPDPGDLEGLSDALTRAVDIAHAALSLPEQQAPQGIRKPYFAQTPEDGFEYFATQAEALEFAQAAIAECKKVAEFDGEWNDDVEHIRVGVVTHAARCDGDEATGYDFCMRQLSTPPAAPEAAKPLFADLIAAAPGLAEELKAVDAQADEIIRQYEKRQAEAVKPETERAELPPLPDAIHTYQAHGGERIPAFSAKQMQDYARAALLAADSKAGREPVFWVRFCSNGMYEGPLHNAQIETVRKDSGAWTPLYTHPQQHAKPLTDEDMQILEAVRREMTWKAHPENAPGHAHSVPGIWDSDNGAMAGEPCAWCLTWKKFTALIESHRIGKNQA